VPQRRAPSNSEQRDSATSRVPKVDSIIETAIESIARSSAPPA
jgi:hypothetical protein